MGGVKVKASTLVETMVAMVLLCIVMGISMVIFLQSTSSSLNYEKVRASILVQNTIEETRSSFSFSDSEVEVENITLVKSVTPYEGQESLVQVEIVAINSENKVLASTYAIFVKDER